jgi:hypothetical protein
MKSMNTQQIENEVNEAFRGLVEASTALNSGRYFDYFDKEKFSGLGADGRVWHSIAPLEEIIAAGFTMVERLISLEFSNVKVTVINQATAILVNEFSQTILLKDKSIVKQSGGGAQVWAKSDDRWKLVSICASDAGQRGEAVF